MVKLNFKALILGLDLEGFLPVLQLTAELWLMDFGILTKIDALPTVRFVSWLCFSSSQVIACFLWMTDQPWNSPLMLVWSEKVLNWQNHNNMCLIWCCISAFSAVSVFLFFIFKFSTFNRDATQVSRKSLTMFFFFLHFPQNWNYCDLGSSSWLPSVLVCTRPFHFVSAKKTLESRQPLLWHPTISKNVITKT